ncbi:phage tail termination protein [Stutzerimonas nitrititolerans]|uniref:phage tail termination protein n=1 Tax=Stutzerimonas nitrititolerans TaxID=2482751 RepID=UPI0028AED2EC|nr:hypothetical protein [Stutzerimonas nitrititolerans]
MYDEFAEWVAAVLGSPYQTSRGQWVDGPAFADVWIASIHAMGGPAVDVDDRRPRYRVILLGPRNGREHAQEIGQAAGALVAATMDGGIPCGAAHIRAITEPAGPGYTTENRPWYSVDLQVTY